MWSHFYVRIMDFEKIFDSFGSINGPEKDSDDVSLLVDFSDHPLYWIGGFTKLISNQLFFEKYTVISFNKIAPEIDIEKLEETSKFLIYSRAWDYIKKIKLDNPLHIDCIKTKANKPFLDALEASIKFFEELEEYEKCALLHNIKLKVKEYFPQ